jgi:hypothetical protein
MFSFPLAGGSALTAKDAVGLVHTGGCAHRKPGSENTYTLHTHSAPTAFHYYWIISRAGDKRGFTHRRLEAVVTVIFEAILAIWRHSRSDAAALW